MHALLARHRADRQRLEWVHERRLDDGRCPICALHSREEWFTVDFELALRALDAAYGGAAPAAVSQGITAALLHTAEAGDGR